MGKQFCKTLNDFSDIHKYKSALKELDLRHQMSMAPMLEPIESPLKQYIHEDMMDKRPTYTNKIKKKDKEKMNDTKDKH